MEKKLIAVTDILLYVALGGLVVFVLLGQTISHMFAPHGHANEGDGHLHDHAQVEE